MVDLTTNRYFYSFMIVIVSICVRPAVCRVAELAFLTRLRDGGQLLRRCCPIPFRHPVAQGRKAPEALLRPEPDQKYLHSPFSGISIF